MAHRLNVGFQPALPSSSFLFVLIAILTLAAGSNEDFAVISGKIYDPVSLKYLIGAQVTWKKQKTFSDRSGSYHIQVPTGVREIVFAFSERPSVKKTIVIREVKQPVTVDVLIPNSLMKPRILADRGSKWTGEGRDLDFDSNVFSNVSVSDEFGNQDSFLPLELRDANAYSPLWMAAEKSLLYGINTIVHQKDQARLGVFRFDLLSKKEEAIATNVGIQHLAKSPHGNALAAANQKQLFIVESGEFRKIFDLGQTLGWILSVAWCRDEIYFTVEDEIPVDDRRSLSRSRIAQIRPDGAGLQSDWASAPQYSFRYPVCSGNAAILFSRFTPDGAEQTLWSATTDAGSAKKILDNALRAVLLDSSKLYYIYKKDLHLRDTQSGSDFIILNSVEHADITAAAGLCANDPLTLQTQ